MSPSIIVGSGSVLRFRYRLDVFGGDCGAGGLQLLFAGGDEPQLLWESCIQTGGWRSVQVDMVSMMGQAGQLIARLTPGASGSAGQAWLDDLGLAGECTLLCDETCDDGNSCTADTCIEGLCVTEPVAGCCQSEAACEDGDPCTADACATGGGCVHTPIVGCTKGGCLADPIGDSLPEGWEFESTSADFTFEIGALGSLSAPGHLVAQAGPDAVGESASLVLPPVEPAGDLSVRFALRQSVGSACELGRLFVVANGAEHALHCGYHDWQTVSVPIVASPGQPLQITLRFDAEQSGPKVEIDDLRLFGSCHPVACVALADGAAVCDDGDACTLDACNAGYACEHLPVDGCCDDDSDCAADGPCQQVACVEGQCVSPPTPGCAEGSCYFAAFDDGLAPGWSFSGPTSATASWTVDAAAAWSAPMALHGTYAQKAGLPTTAVARLPPLLIGSGDADLTFRVKRSLSGSGCDAGAVELWLNEELAWVACDSGDWETVTIPLGPRVGTVVSMQLRLRADPGDGAVGHVWVDDVAVSGTCAAVGCATGADCDDGEICTDDACLGFVCVYTTNEAACDDGDACTGGDTCVEGACVSSEVFCDDGETCTDDSCDPALGCQFVPNAAPCDDADPCTAGDSCTGGLCEGSPILCKDFNGCTVDGCTPGVGCEYVAEPFGTPCADGGAVYGTCWDGLCVDWTVGISTLPDSTVHAIAPRTGPAPLRLAGALDTTAAAFRVDQNSLELVIETQDPNRPRWRDAHGELVVGDSGGIGAAVTGVQVPGVEVGAGLDLHALTSAGSTWFLAGDGSTVDAVTSTVRRCQQIAGGWGACSTMPVVHSQAKCGKQRPFHARALLALSSQTLLVAGASIENGDYVARVAVWDGNTVDDCEPLGVYSGEVYTDEPGEPLTLAVDQAGAGEREAFLALSGAPDNVWAVGRRGLVFRFDGEVWQAFSPGAQLGAKGFSSAADVHGVAATDDAVHLVGDGVGLADPGCRHGFYLHGARSGDAFVFDRYVVFDSGTADCGDAPFDGLGLRDVLLDDLTDDLYVVGWGQGPQGDRRGLVLRLERP